MTIIQKRHYLIILFICICFMYSATSNVAHAQFSKVSSKSFKDSLDNKFDMSDYIIDAHGFVPVPAIVTEQALGGFGGALAPIFLTKRPPIVDTIKGKPVYTPVMPNITGGAGFYTANKTWGIGLGHNGTYIKHQIRYRIMGAYANVNMNFYRDFMGESDHEFNFNFKTIPALAFAMKRIGHTDLYIGAQYLFMYTEVNPDFGLNIDKSKLEELFHFDNTSIISQLGIIAEFDNRDNMFTPNKGVKVHFDAGYSGSVWGSDYNYWRMNYYAYMYKPILHNLIGGLRIDGQQAFDSPPFYMLPYIDMRGVEAERYQGNADILTEAELRWDIVPRWSVLGFGGVGKAFDKWSEFGSADWVYSYGIGGRYLLARKFGLRVGVDLAKGPDNQWGYYIVFGSSWLK